jgi:hypothetical protein
VEKAVGAISGEQIRGRYVILRSDDQVQTNSKKSKKRKERVGGVGGRERESTC